MIIPKKLRLCLLLTLVLFVAGAVIIGEAFAAAANWFDEDWAYRRQITIDHNQVENVAVPSTTYADFPLLVFATGLSNINANGTDIRFTASDGVSELPREIESYSGGTLYAWVKVTLTKDAGDSTDDVIFMYYGNPAATEPAPSSPNGSENVWDSNFMMVQHLQESPNDGVAGHIDSTSNSNNGTPNNFENSVNGTTDAVGKINGANDFAGDDDFVTVNYNTDLNPAIFTVSVWVKVTGGLGAFQTPIDARSTSSSLRGYNIYAKNNDTWSIWLGDGTPGWIQVSGGTVVLDKWTFVVGIYNGSAGLLYVDGILAGGPTTTPFVQNPDVDTTIGALGAPALFLNGIIDEVRISNTNRSLGWIKTSYRNQNDPSSFLTVSEEAVVIPTMTEWGMIIFAVLVGFGSIYYLRRKRIES